jgi:hypothetical protein
MNVAMVSAAWPPESFEGSTVVDKCLIAGNAASVL